MLLFCSINQYGWEVLLTTKGQGILDPKSLLYQLDEIGRSLEQSGHALALIGLGSTGLELDRLDFFPIWISLSL